jgi:hypothetical protein
MNYVQPRALTIPIAVFAVFGGVVLSGTPGVGAAVSRVVMSSNTKIQPCVAKATIKPKSYVIACADANTEIRSMTWKSWTSSSAVGTGIYEFNTCTPTCVAGHFVNDSATVTLSKPKSGTSGKVFSLMTVKYRTSKTKSITTRFTLPLKAF